MIFANVLMFLQLVPSLIQLIVQLNQIFAPADSATKKLVLMNAVTASGVPVDMHPVISKFVDDMVRSINSTKPAA